MKQRLAFYFLLLALPVHGQVVANSAGEPALDDQAAMTRCEATLSTSPGNKQAAQGEVNAAVRLALEARRAGRQDDALAYLLRARRFVPENPALLLDFGVQADGMRLYRDADTALTEAARLSPGDPQILYALGHVKLDEQQMPEAEKYLRRYLALRPDDASAHYGLGRLLHMQLRDDEAAAELEKSIALQPAQTESYYELGSIYLGQYQNVKAEGEFKIALKRNPEHAGALAGMGEIMLREKKYAEAVNLLQHSLAIAPSYPGTHRSLALALAKLGRAADSEKELATAQKLTEEQDRERGGLVLQRSPAPR